MAQLSDDCFAFGGTLLSVDAALALIAERVTPVAGEESVPLGAACGRILVRDLVAEMDLPPHANSAVDGYAIVHADLSTDRDTVLPVTGRAAAGHPLDRAIARGEAIRIFTGAPMPEGADTVMMQEDCDLTGGRVTMKPGLKQGANRRHAGEDVAKGSVALTAGRRLKPADLGLAAALGCARLQVRQPLRVALLSTGDEVREPERRCRRARSMTRTASCWPRCWRVSAAGSAISAFAPTARQRLPTRWRTRRPSTI